MYRLLIVEDEKWEREGLRDFLDWSSLGIEVAGCACNGAEGMEMAELYRPDIILSDVMMPKMDGIRMSQNIRAFLPDTRIIIISGYDDFQYAKQSFRFHAFSYVLKPIEKKAFEDVIFSVLKALEQEKSRKREREVLKSQWNDYLSANRDRLLLDLLECRMKLGNVHEILLPDCLGTRGKKLVAVLSFCRDCSPEMVNAFGRLLNSRKIAFSFVKPFREAVLCMAAPSAQSETEAELLELKDEIRRELGIDTIIGVGNAAESFDKASVSYTQAKEAGSFRFLAEYGELLFYNRLSEAGSNDRDKVTPLILRANDIIKKILYSFHKGDMEEIDLLADAFLSALREKPSISKMLLNSFFTQLMNESGKGYAVDFNALDSLTSTKQYILSLLGTNASSEAEKKSDCESEVVKKVIEIIEGRYADALNLKLISGEIHLTPYYIGSIFKKHTGMLFSQYLSDYRIQKAKELLHTRKIKVSHLAEAVGIRNFSYFSSLFKSRFGITPGNYKDILKGGRENV